MGDRRTKASPSFKSAKRDVMLSERPYLQELKRTGKQAKRQTRQSSRRTAGIYKSLGRELKPLSGQYEHQAQGISDGLQSDLSNFTGMLGSDVPGVPQSEIAAGTGLFGTIGAGTLQDLASQQGRNLAYNTSARRQGSIESATQRRNYQTDLSNFMKDLGQQRLDLMRGVPQQILARKDELARIAFDQLMANRNFGLQSSQVNQANASNSALAGLYGGLSPAQIAAMFGGG